MSAKGFIIKKRFYFTVAVTLTIVVAAVFMLMRNPDVTTMGEMPDSTDVTSEASDSADGTGVTPDSADGTGESSDSADGAVIMSDATPDELLENTAPAVEFKMPERYAYLTFDDGPTNITEQMLDILKEHEIRATFFVLGVMVDNNPQILRRIHNEGHLIANHSYSHKYNDIYKDTQSLKDEIQKAQASIQKALDIPDYNSFFFRFPGGSMGKRKELLDAVHSIGYEYVDWNSVGQDSISKTITAGEIFNYVVSTAENAANPNELIILLHDSATMLETVKAVPDIITHFKNEGYVFTTLKKGIM